MVGVGNIYASEVLFASRIVPTAAANSISTVKAKRLYQAIRDILALAVERGGTTLRDFSNADGMPGHFQLQAKVYGRNGLPCVHCGKAIALLRQGRRSTFYCPHCQKA
ncbi:Formamidopyrimidine-DNA glycosylase [compost metagenome]